MAWILYQILFRFGEGPWEGPREGPREGPWKATREGTREGVATKDIHTVNTPSGGGIFCVDQYSKLLTKNTPPPNIRNINIIIIPRMKGGIITLNKNEFLVYNFFLPGQSCYIFNVQLFMSVCSAFSSCEFCDEAILMKSMLCLRIYSICSYPVFAK